MIQKLFFMYARLISVKDMKSNALSEIAFFHYTRNFCAEMIQNFFFYVCADLRKKYEVKCLN